MSERISKKDERLARALAAYYFWSKPHLEGVADERIEEYWPDFVNITKNVNKCLNTMKHDNLSGVIHEANSSPVVLV